MSARDRSPSRAGGAVGLTVAGHQPGRYGPGHEHGDIESRLLLAGANR